ncbi:MAG TPA: 5-oxoprolinase subunit PxpB [Pyrinomonadaceae bacterium]|nr:5-oxoprolinase subunit PxpB [Pyrinomonadaceae bacterium]
MDAGPPRVFPLGDDAITVEFGNEISEPLNQAAIALSEHITANPFPGFVEAVPAYSSATFFYRVPGVLKEIDDAADTAFDAVKRKLLDAVRQGTDSRAITAREVIIPVRFGPNEALDLMTIAEHSGLSPDEAVSIFLSGTYRVFMLGFLPGFAYMGTVDERIAVPRHPAPRLKVPKGSVGIAGRQTGIYPSESPGGWQIIGLTDLELLTGDASSPCILHPGDNVRFVRATE